MLRRVTENAVPIGQAARMLGVSIETVRRWDAAGRIETVRDERNRRLVPRSEIARLRPAAVRPPGDEGSRQRSLSARNRLTGTVTSVEVDGVMGLVELECGPYRLVAAVTRDAIEDLGLEPGVQAAATVKSTSVMVERISSPERA